MYDDLAPWEKNTDSAETVEFMATAKVTENGMRGVRKLLKSSTTFACERDCRQFENQLQVCTWLSGVRGSILFFVTSKLTFSFASGPGNDVYQYVICITRRSSILDRVRRNKTTAAIQS